MTNRKRNRLTSASDPEFKSKSNAMEIMMAWDQLYLAKYAYRLKEKLTATEQKVILLEEHIQKLKLQTVETTQKKNKKEVFNAEWPYSKKILFIFSSLQKPMTALEIDDYLCYHDPVYKLYKDRRGTLYGILHRAIKMKIISTVEIPGNRHKYYCFNDWLNNFNQLLPEYKKKIALF